MQKIVAVFFDLDGVLQDSKEANYTWWKSFLESNGYKMPTIQEFGMVFGGDRLTMLEALSGERSKEKLDELFKLTYQHPYPVDLLKPRKGEVETLSELSKTYKLGVVTNGHRTSVERFFKIADIEKYFSVIVARDDITNIKPNPESLLLASKKLGIEPKAVIYVGDNDVDVAAAHSAGMKIVGFSDEEMEGADVVVSSFLEIPKAIESLG